MSGLQGSQADAVGTERREGGAASARKTVADELAASALGLEASLLPTSSRLRRRFPVPGLDREYLRYLEARIRRDRRDLHAHVERVLLRAQRGESPRLYAAFIDLYIAVAPAGRELRRGLLARAGMSLTDEQRATLEAHLDIALDASHPHAAVRGACLSRPTAGTTPIVRRADPTGPERVSAVALAAQAIAAGDDSIAQELLEAALDADPGRPEVCLQLLALYRRQRLRVDFERTHTSQLGRRLACADEWQRTRAYFASHRVPTGERTVRLGGNR